MSFLIILFILSAAAVCLLSYIIADKRRGVFSSTEDAANTLTSCPGETGQATEDEQARKSRIQKIFAENTVSKLIILFISVLLGGALCFFTGALSRDGAGVDAIVLVKIAVTYLVVLSAAIVDFYTKKIPNLLPLILAAFGVAALVIELILSPGDSKILLLSSGIGLAVSFIVLLVISLVTKGGLGMGDVKLISAFGLVMGAAGVVYSLGAASLLCLFVSLFLLAFKRKKLKDELPFAPFFYMGFVISVIFGKF